VSRPSLAELARLASGPPAGPTSQLWLHRPDLWSGMVLGVALMGRSFRPSLMPRKTAHQAMVSGASGAIGFGVANAVYGLVARTGHTGVDVALLGAAGGAGFAVSRLLSEQEDEAHWRPVVRSTGSAVAAGATAATLGVVLRGMPHHYRTYAGLALTAVSALSGARAITAGVKAQRDAHDEYDPPPPKALPAVYQSVGIAAGLTGLVTAMRHSSGVVARTLEKRIGLPPGASRWLGRGVAVAGWSVTAKSLADVFVDGLRTYDRVVDAGSDRAPTNPLRTSGPGSPIAFARLGRQGRRFVLNVPTRQEMADVSGAVDPMDPIRVYIGYAAARTDEERVDLAMQELRRTGAFDRRLLVVGCPAGNGLVNTLALELVDHLTGGDSAAVAVQYGRLPSFLTLRRVSRGGHVQRLLLASIQRELADRQHHERPRVVVYGESLGAWAGQDTFIHRGVDGLDELGVDRALWAGTPYYSAWRHEVLVRRSVAVPDGSVVEIDRPETVASMTDEQRAVLRAVIIGHGNDPVRYLGLGLLVRRPVWLSRDPSLRPWGVPPDMQFLPGITGIQVIVDAINATRPVPGVFRATGHEYNADLPEAVAAAFGLPKPDAVVWPRLIAHLAEVDERRFTANRPPRKAEIDPSGGSSRS
jgi:uncharacterized membrane protein